MLPRAAPEGFRGKNEILLYESIFVITKKETKDKNVHITKYWRGQNLLNFDIYYISFILQPLQSFVLSGKGWSTDRKELIVSLSFHLADILYCKFEHFCPIVTHMVRICVIILLLNDYSAITLPFYRNKIFLPGEKCLCYGENLLICFGNVREKGILEKHIFNLANKLGDMVVWLWKVGNLSGR